MANSNNHNTSSNRNSSGDEQAFNDTIKDPDSPEELAKRLGSYVETDPVKNPHAAGIGDDKPWVTDEAIDAMVMERTVSPSESEEALSKRIMRESLPVLTTNLIHLAVHSGSETTRLRASTYLLDRVLGKPGQDAAGAVSDPLTELLEEMAKAEANNTNNANNKGR
jgi:hypothetical protein